MAAGRYNEARPLMTQLETLLDGRDAERRLARIETEGDEIDPETLPFPRYGHESNALRTNAERFAAIVGSGTDRGVDSATREREYAEDFLTYIHSRGRHVGTLLHAVNAEYAALNIGSDYDGVGYLAPGDIRTTILSRLPAVSEILNLVTPTQARGNPVTWPRVRPATGDDASVYTSAGIGQMVPESPASGTPTEPSFGTFSIPIRRARYIARPTLDAIADIPGLTSFLSDDASVNLALLAERQLIAGSGVGHNVRGVVHHPRAANGSQNEDQIGTVDVEGTTSNHVSNTTAAAGSAPKLLDLFYSVPAQYRRQPGFRVVFNSDTERRMRGLVDADGHFMWTSDGGFGAPVDGFLNKPVAVSEAMQSGGTDANRVILAGDLAAIIFAVAGGIRIQVADQLYAENDQIGLFVRWRFGSGVSNPDALRLGIV
jgi:HK97 family phage major capsid protein